MFRGPAARLALLALAACMAASAAGCVAYSHAADLSTTDLAGPRLLVIAPHPDDETLGTGGAIALARQRGWKVTVVFVTSGDGFIQAVRHKGEPVPTAAKMQAYGSSRVAEARRATENLGVPESDVICLGFPDGSTHFLWGTKWDGPALLGMNGADRVPYSYAMKPGAPYTGAELESEIEQIVRRVRPTTVLMPDAADVHRDHWAVNAFAQTALVRTGFDGLALTYVVHRAGYPALRGEHDGAPLDAPVTLRDTGTRWVTLPLGNIARQGQSAALAEYASQLRSDGRFVRSFIRANEVFGLPPRAVLVTGTVMLHQGAHDPHFRGGRPSAFIQTVELARGDTSSTVTLELAAPIQPSVLYALHLRAFGPEGRMRVYEARVSGRRLTAVRTTSACVRGRGALLGSARDAVRVRVPGELLDGAEWLFVGADTYTAGGLTSDHAAWRMVRIAAR